ncbi:MAG: helix-turn-helix domain-containing protein [Verrucomicrobiota bacterium]|jgi:hypothetical protein
MTQEPSLLIKENNMTKAKTTTKIAQAGTGNASKGAAPVPPAAHNYPADLPYPINTIADTATFLKCSTKSVRRLIDKKLLSASKGLRHIRITREAILAYLANTSK